MHMRCKARTEHAKVGWRANHDDDDIRFEATTADWLRLTASTLNLDGQGHDREGYSHLTSIDTIEPIRRVSFDE